MSVLPLRVYVNLYIYSHRVHCWFYTFAVFILYELATQHVQSCVYEFCKLNHVLSNVCHAGTCGYDSLEFPVLNVLFEHWQYGKSAHAVTMTIVAFIPIASTLSMFSSAIFNESPVYHGEKVLVKLTWISWSSSHLHCDVSHSWTELERLVKTFLVFLFFFHHLIGNTDSIAETITRKKQMCAIKHICQGDDLFSQWIMARFRDGSMTFHV